MARKGLMTDMAPLGKTQKAEIIRFCDHASPDLHRLLVRRLGNIDEAREVAQDAFEQLIHHAGREDIRDLRKFFFAMANRLAVDALRRRGVRERYLRTEESNQEEPHRESDPERILIGRERLQDVRKVLRCLPVKTQQVFLLHRFEGYTYAEIARQIGLSVKSIEYHMSKALLAITTTIDAVDE